MDMNNTAAHCLIIPYPIQGHINPMLQFAKRLAFKHVRVTFVVTKYLHKTMNNINSCGSVSIRAISDGFDEGGRAQAQSIAEYRARLRNVGQAELSELLKELQDVDCVIYDPFISWVRNVAKGFGMHVATFFTQSCGVDNIYYQVLAGEIKLPLSSDTELVLVPGLPPLKPDELPSFVYLSESYSDGLHMFVNQFQNIDKADWVLVNTFEELEVEAIEWLSRFFRVKAIGPTVPSMYLDKRLQEDTKYDINIFDSRTNVCINWLDQQELTSVVYVSFGSIAQLNADQTNEVAFALKTINKPFLWVVRATEEAKLPENFLKETSDKGLTVTWSPQLEVLSHKALGCFVTHCGWNSTLEALSLGVPLVAIPRWSDQSTNAKLVEDVWKVGVRAQPDKNGLVTQGEIVQCVMRVMEGEEGEKIRTAANKWKQTTKEAVDKGGSSDRNIDYFVSNLTTRVV